jgi:hypothetical protein
MILLPTYLLLNRLVLSSLDTRSRGQWVAGGYYLSSQLYSLSTLVLPHDFKSCDDIELEMQTWDGKYGAQS